MVRWAHVSATTRPRVVIIGGGFGGLWAAKRLARAPVDVLLIDRRNHHVFSPLLYQVATAGLSPGDIASPIRWILRRQNNLKVWLAEATSVDVTRKCVTLADGEIGYDHLIVAAGSRPSYFGHDDWAAHARGLKTMEDAIAMRQHCLVAIGSDQHPHARRYMRFHELTHLTDELAMIDRSRGVWYVPAEHGAKGRHDFRVAMQLHYLKICQHRSQIPLADLGNLKVTVALS